MTIIFEIRYNQTNILMIKLFLLYIDPGSGSLFYQVLIGGILSAAMFAKTYWVKFKSIFKKLVSKDKQDAKNFTN